MSSISEATLFISTNSRASLEALNFVRKYQLPFQIVRLDTTESREQAANGKHFQILSVPTMVILYEDGNTQLFLGYTKITQWLTALLKSKKESEAREHSQNMYEPQTEYIPQERYERDPQPLSHKVPARPSTLKVRRDAGEDTRKTVAKEIQVDTGEDIMIEEEPQIEFEPEEHVVIEKPKGRRKKNKKTQEEEAEDEFNPVKMAKDKLNKAASLKSKPQSSKMKSVYNTAKQMEIDAKASLGYKEEDLPHF